MAPRVHPTWYTKKCLKDVKVRHENREGDPEADAIAAAAARHTNNLLRAAQEGFRASPMKADAPKLKAPKRRLTAVELTTVAAKKKLAALPLKIGAIHRELGNVALTSDEMQLMFTAKVDVAAEEFEEKMKKKDEKKDETHAKATAILSSGKAPDQMKKAELDTLLRDKGVTVGTNVAASLALVKQHYRASPPPSPPPPSD